MDSAVGEGSSTTPGMHPKTSCWGRRPSWAALHPSSHRFIFYFFVFWGTEVSVGGTDIRTENEPEKGGRNLQEMAGSRRVGLRCSQGAWRGPLQQVGERESGGRHGRRAVLLTIPALPEPTDCHPIPAPVPSLPPQPLLNKHWEANPSLSLPGRARSRGGDSG